MERNEFLKALNDVSSQQMDTSTSKANARPESESESVSKFEFTTSIDMEQTRPPMPDLPLKDLMGDSLLRLIYTTPYQLPYDFQHVHQALIELTSESNPWRVRVDAALTIGRFVADRQEAYPQHKLGMFHNAGNVWFRYARDLGSPAGALICAEDLLSSANLRVALDLQNDPLPRLLSIKNRDPKVLPAAVVQEWLYAIGLITTASQERLIEWSPKDWTSSLEAIVNYLCIVPETSFSHRFDEASDVQEWRRRLDALSWIKPLWETVLDAMECNSNVARPNYQKMQALRTQQQIIITKLRYQVASHDSGFGQYTTRKSSPENLAEDDSNVLDQLVVITTPIPVSNDKEDRSILKQYEKLRQPLPFITLPGLDELRSIKQALMNEFPWATQAVNMVMSDLFARKWHGVKRLGMMPILLVGPPGAGKTRFAQRFGELLQTESLVLNLAGMSDAKVLKGFTRGWASARPSRIAEFMLQTSVPNPVIILDEVDKTGSYGHGGNPQEALLDLLEPGNASRYQDIYLMASCDLSHCLYVLTSNATDRLTEPLLSRMRPVLFPTPGPEHTSIIVNGVIRDLEKTWNLPKETITLSPAEHLTLEGLSPREMRFAIIDLLGNPAIKSDKNLH